jgi:hypothetical protein
VKKLTLVSAICLFAFPVLASAQIFYRPYYEQRSLGATQTLPYFLENRTGSPLRVTLLVELPTGGKELWLFKIDPNSEVDAMLPVGGARVIVSVAIASVPKGDKIKLEKVKSYLYNREDKDGKVERGWLFFRQ